MDNQNNALKIAVVTAMFLIETNEMDECGGVPDKIEGWDYILFTNDKTKLKNVDNWDIREIDCTKYTHGVYASKHVKWFTHEYLPDYDNIIWVDSFITPNKQLLNQLNTMISSVNTNPAMPLIMRTQKFECIKDDIDWCLINNRITKQMATNIINHIDASGIIKVNEPVQTCWSAAIVKNNRHAVLKEMVTELFELVTTIGYRDQHWLPYLLKKYNLHAGINKVKDVFVITGKQIKTNHHYVNFF